MRDGVDRWATAPPLARDVAADIGVETLVRHLLYLGRREAVALVDQTGESRRRDGTVLHPRHLGALGGETGAETEGGHTLGQDREALGGGTRGTTDTCGLSGAISLSIRPRYVPYSGMRMRTLRIPTVVVPFQ